MQVTPHRQTVDNHERKLLPPLVEKYNMSLFVHANPILLVLACQHGYVQFVTILSNFTDVKPYCGKSLNTPFSPIPFSEHSV